MRPVFFDTNVVLYLLSADVHKADAAEALLARGAWSAFRCSMKRHQCADAS